MDEEPKYKFILIQINNKNMLRHKPDKLSNSSEIPQIRQKVEIVDETLLPLGMDEATLCNFCLLLRSLYWDGQGKFVVIFKGSSVAGYSHIDKGRPARVFGQHSDYDVVVFTNKEIIKPKRGKKYGARKDEVEGHDVFVISGFSAMDVFKRYCKPENYTHMPIFLKCIVGENEIQRQLIGCRFNFETDSYGESYGELLSSDFW